MLESKKKTMNGLSIEMAVEVDSASFEGFIRDNVLRLGQEAEGIPI